MYIERTDAEFVNTPNQILTEKPCTIALYNTAQQLLGDNEKILSEGK